MPGWLIVLYVANVALGAVLYLDVVRRGRSGWWLIAFWLFTIPAVIAYLITRRQKETA